MLLDLVPDSLVQGELLWDEAPTERRDRTRLMEALDHVTRPLGEADVAAVRQPGMTKVLIPGA